MTPVATTQPELTPTQRAQQAIHQLLRRGLRLVKPETDAERAERAVALSKLNDDAKEYHDWRGIEAEAKEHADALKPSILAAVGRLGSVPDSAPKSRRCETAHFICTNTTGNKLEILHENVLQFDMAMTTKKQQEIFNQLFVRSVEYTLSPAAHQLIEHGDLPKAQAEEIRAAFARCFSASTTSTTLKVESKAELAAKQAEAAEKRATKKAGKAAA